MWQSAGVNAGGARSIRMVTDSIQRSSGAAVLWTGGFPCQDLSVAGKRRGMGTHADRLDTRSGLAYAFLDLVERHRPPAIVLENVPGLLSSNGGRDLGALLGRLGELGYWWAYRVLDARHFGVPQRRRRVFIVAIHARIDPSGDGPAEVLSVGSRCDRHPATGGEARAGAPGGAVPALTSLARSSEPPASDTTRTSTPSSPKSVQPGPTPGSNATAAGPRRPSPDPRRVRAADGLAGRLDDRADVAGALRASDGHHGHGSPRGDGGDNLVVGALDQRRGGADDNEAQAGHLIAAFVKRGRAQTADDGETWGDGDVMPTLNGFDVGDVRTTAAILGTDTGADPLLPDGLDSHRYRCCGNGVVADVAEWLGQRLAGYFA
jgi:site-specific DNA-cytosine methylase